MVLLLIIIIVATVPLGQLRTLRDEVLRVRQSVSPPRLTVVELVVMDLGDLSLFDEAALALFVNGLQHQPLVKYSRTTFINNAGSLILGYTGRADSSPSAVEMDSYVRLNQTSPNYLTDCLVKFFSEGKLNTDEVRIVNVSSLVAVQNFPSWGQYSSVKAGREMFHSNVALEWAEDPRLKVLNYAPGPLNTNVSIALVFCVEAGGVRICVSYAFVLYCSSISCYVSSCVYMCVCMSVLVVVLLTFSLHIVSFPSCV